MAGTEVSTRDRLVETGRDLFLEVGPSGFSLREVARRTGITAAAVYRHFDDREALLQAVCAEGFRVFGSYLLASLAKDKPLERLRAAGRQYLRFALERPRDYHVIFMSEAKGERHERSETGPETFQFLVDRVRECIDARVLRRGDARELAATIWAHVHGMVSLRLSGHLSEVGDDEAFERWYARSTDDLIAGLSR